MIGEENGKEIVDEREGEKVIPIFKEEEGEEMKPLVKGNNDKSIVSVKEVFEEEDEKRVVKKFEYLNSQFSELREGCKRVDKDVIIEKKHVDQHPTLQSTSQLQQRDLNNPNLSFSNNHSILGEEKLGILYYSMQMASFESSSIQSDFLQHHHSYSSLIHHLQPEQDWSLLSSQFFQT